MSSEDPLSSDLIPAPLRDALRLSPDNAPLLLHIAETVLKLGGFSEAETLFKRALALSPDNLTAKLGLASAFYHLGKRSAALVIVEAITPADTAPATALVLHARLALQAGETRFAARLYQRARTATPPLTDPSLEEELAPHLSAAPAPARPSAKPPAPLNEISASPPEESWRGTSDNDADDAGRERLPAGDLPDDIAPGELERPSISFADVGGMDHVKEEVRMKIILPLQQPDLFKAYGKKAGGGILMYGPPGCGKTFLARATAGEVKAGFLAIGINDVLDMWIGQSEKNLHALFEQARANRPCVLFFDEVDALGANRTDLLKSGGRQLINQFLSELDGVTASNEGVLILAATNAPWHLDPAFRRPGRFDRILFVPPPDLPARASILRLLLKGKPVEPIDFDALAKKTDGYSGADLQAVVETAVEAKLREAMKSGGLKPLGNRDLLDAAKRHKPTVRDWFETSRNYALYANQSGLYDDILEYLKLKK
ncbi:MAG: ATP-binding protein [Rariglobus sp.]|jgi:AAA+ superfamily predicted ATPase|nr:ATP-binding protein [Rariglobus sp.]